MSNLLTSNAIITDGRINAVRAINRNLITFESMRLPRQRVGVSFSNRLHIFSKL